MLKKIILSAFILCLNISAYCQKEYVSPLNIPLELSANFGEIRTNHFHSGVDFKTGGSEGKDVFAVADGYVSRIFASPSGFGKALYVTHPAKGTVSVYGHLQSFSNEIEEYVRKEQYRKHSFSVDLTPENHAFVVLAGEKIAVSGNSGSSGGPHLHFEIRDGATASPVNIITRGYFSINDTTPPQILSVSLVEIDSLENVPVHTILKRSAVIRDNTGKLRLEQDTFKISKPSYFTVEVTDRKNNSTNIFGIYSLTAQRNDNPYFGFAIDNFSFADTRYVNTLCKFPETSLNRNDLIRTYISPNNNLKFYDKTVSRGVIYPKTIDDTENINITVCDDSNNSTSILFHITKSDTLSDPPVLNGKPINWRTGGTVSDEGVEVRIPEKALYESSFINIKKLPATKETLSNLYIVGNKGEPIQKSIEISISADTLSSELHSKALLISVASGKISNVGGEYKDGKVTSKSSSFGTFAIAIDKTPPKITPLYKAEESQAGKKYLSFKITDNLSGIQSYKAVINDKWALLEYDPKTATIRHPLKDGIAVKGANSIKVTVTDAKGNSKTYNSKFNY